MTLLDVKNLHLTIGNQVILDDISFSVAKGETLALIGESGAGKSMTANALMQLLPPHSHMRSTIRFDGKMLHQFAQRDMQQIRGQDMAMIYQDPLGALNPLHRIGKQLAEVLWIHLRIPARKAKPTVLEWLNRVQIDDPEECLLKFPYQLSGGQRQRVMIAMALINRPQLLIADEPTTAVDVILQQNILDLLLDLQKELGMACIFITHDTEIAQKMAHRIAVMRQGKIIEQGKAVLQKPKTSYAKLLADADPKPLNAKTGKSKTLLTVNHLWVGYAQRGGLLQKKRPEFVACRDLNFTIGEGTSLGIVGQSGSGKSSLARALLKLIPSRGEILYRGTDLNLLAPKQMKPLRREIQILFQQPATALSPRMTIEDIIAEGLDVHGLAENREQRLQKVIEAMQAVDLDPEVRHRHAHQFSGGQSQRIALARVLALEPKLLVLDEPTSSLDVVHQAQILELLKKLQTQKKISYIFISHDIKAVRAVSHQLLVMYRAEAVDYGRTEDIIKNPKDPYTEQLIAASYLR